MRSTPSSACARPTSRPAARRRSSSEATDTLRELLPGTWTIEEGKIVVTVDGVVEVLETNWVSARLELRAAEQVARMKAAEALKEHLATKREVRREPRGGRGT